MSKAAQLVSKLIEGGPDDMNPKGEFMRLPDQTFGVNVNDYGGDTEDDDYVWRRDLAEQLNRLSALAAQLNSEGKHAESEDLKSIIKRVSELEEIHEIPR